MDALQLLAMREIKPVVIERSSQQPGATGKVLAGFTWRPIAQPEPVTKDLR